MTGSGSAKNAFGVELNYARSWVRLTLLGVSTWSLFSYFYLGSSHLQLRIGAVVTGCALLLFGSIFRRRPQTPGLMFFVNSLILMAMSVFDLCLSPYHSIAVVVMSLTSLSAATNMRNRKLYLLWLAVYLASVTYLYLEDIPGFPAKVLFALTPFMLLLSYADVSSRSKVRDELAKEEDRLASVMRVMNEGVMLCLPDGTIKAANDAAISILGLDNIKSSASESFRKLNYILYKEDGTRYKSEELPNAVAFRTGQPCLNQVFNFERPDGQKVWVRAHAVPIGMTPGGVAREVVLTFEEFTAMKEKEKLIIEQGIMLAGLARFTAIGEMAAGIAHEINNPLAIISGRLFQLRRYITGAEKEQQAGELIGKIESTVKRISKIIVSMRSLARDGESDPFEQAKIVTIFEDTLLLLREKLEKAEIDMRVKINANLSIECRSSQIAQVLLNLVHNSHDAILDLKERWIEIVAEEVGEHVMISIKDSGTGIPRDIREKIMQPFFTTKEPGKGTGLGLSITANIIRSHRGNFFIDESCPNTCFKIMLPMIQIGANRPPVAA